MKTLKLVVCEVLAVIFTALSVYALYTKGFQALGLSAFLGLVFIVKSGEYV